MKGIKTCIQCVICVITVASVLCCASRKREGTTSGQVTAQWNIAEVRAAVEDALVYYGPVKRDERNRFQSSRIPTNRLANLGQEFTVLTVKIDPTYPHRVYISSTVFVQTEETSDEFKPNGTHPDLEKRALAQIHGVLKSIK